MERFIGDSGLRMSVGAYGFRPVAEQIFQLLKQIVATVGHCLRVIPQFLDFPDDSIGPFSCMTAM